MLILALVMAIDLPPFEIPEDGNPATRGYYERGIAAHKKYIECLASNSDRLALKSKESARDIADAVMGICAPHKMDQDELVRWIYRTHPNAESLISADLARSEEKSRQALVARIVQIRAR